MSHSLSQQDKISRGSEDAGKYFHTMAEFVGFTQADADAIRESALVIEKHIPNIVSQFYEHLLRYPLTRKHFLKRDGTLDKEYLQLRMHHLTNFWRRTAGGVYDDEYARYVDYVGRAHTNRGADPTIYIAERYVIGQVGFMQHAINEALTRELHEYDHELEQRARRAWGLLMMVILELLARAYTDEHETGMDSAPLTFDPRFVQQMAVETYEQGLGLVREPKYKDVLVGSASEISDGERKLIQVDDFSIGVFHHRGQWYAIRNSCLHRGGPVAAGSLEGDVITCPWHGYQYDLTNGSLLVDPSAKLQTFPVTIQDGNVFLRVPDLVAGRVERADEVEETSETAVQPRPDLKPNEFFAADLAPGTVKKIEVGRQQIAVYNVAGKFYATQEQCTHAGGPLSEGELSDQEITCPWHFSCFDVTNGEVKCGPARVALRTYPVSIRGDVVCVEIGSEENQAAG